MCQHIVILAERSPQQYVSQCEHGTVHLIWDGVGLHLPGEAFNRLAAHMLRTRSVLQERGEPIGQSHCRLNVGKMSIILPAQDFLLLVEMVDGVLPKLNLAGIEETNPLLQLARHNPVPPVLN
ncbi:MAG: hypothetical protein OXF62_00875 [Caldilineaceae bacterium]|nr:hypothetical protein [Caldilineaceae bacterium]